MRPITITRTLATADADGIAQLQQAVGAGDLTLNGALVTSGVAQLGAQRVVGIASTGNLSAVNFTVYGTNQAGSAISQTIAGPNNNTVSTTLDFLTVTRVAVSAAVGTDVTVGTTGVGGSPAIPLDQYISPFNVSVGCTVSGTVNYTAQYTFDDVFASVGPFTWTDFGDLTSKTATDDGTFISPVVAVRLLTNSGTGTVVMRVIQAGLT